MIELDCILADARGMPVALLTKPALWFMGNVKVKSYESF
jgi:hypothetical protein